MVPGLSADPSAARAPCRRIGSGSHALDTLPALSRQAPMTCAAAPSGPAYRTSGHAARPDNPSAPVKRHLTGRMYQPRRSGLRAGFPVLTSGPVESYFKPNAAGALDIAGVVGARAADCGARAVGPRVGRRGARSNAGQGVSAGERDLHRAAIPASCRQGDGSSRRVPRSAASCRSRSSRSPTSRPDGGVRRTAHSRLVTPSLVTGSRYRQPGGLYSPVTLGARYHVSVHVGVAPSAAVERWSGVQP